MSQESKFEFRLETNCSKGRQGGNPGYTYMGDIPPDVRTFESIIENANAALGLCGQCIGEACQTWKLANSTVDEVKIALGYSAELPSPDRTQTQANSST